MNPSSYHMQKEIVSRIYWKDLKQLSLKEMLIENNLTLPWLFLSWVLANAGYYITALPCYAFFFLTALRQVHNGFHQSLGAARPLTWLTLFANSILMMTAVHAVQFNHLRHHKYCLSEEDYEGKPARMTWYAAILYGPAHIWLIHKMTWIAGNKTYRRNMLLELATMALFAVFVFYCKIPFLVYHIIAMIVAEFLMAFFAVWTVHHDTEERPLLARTQRKRWKNSLTYNMFYHMEHHLFPAVPTIKLPELARRIDEAFPEMDKKQTF